MKAAVWHGKRDIRVEETTAPERAGPGEVIVEVALCGICGTDLHEYTEGPQYIPLEPHPLTGATAPVIMGHELAGTVVDVGPGVTRVKVGDRVAVNPLQYCGSCPGCRRHVPAACERLAGMGLQTRWGGFARYALIKEYQLVPLPEALGFVHGAVLEPASVALHAVDQGGVRPGDVVLVTGGGPIGQLVTMAARAAGARAVYLSEVTPVRQELAARNAEPTQVLDPTRVNVPQVLREHTDGAGADVVFECSANERAFADALEATRKGGTMVQVAVFTRAVALNPAHLTNFERRIQGTLCYLPGDFERTLGLMVAGRLPAERVVTSIIDVDDVVERGFDELIRPDTRNAKILVRPVPTSS